MGGRRESGPRRTGRRGGPDVWGERHHRESVLSSGPTRDSEWLRVEARLRLTFDSGRGKTPNGPTGDRGTLGTESLGACLYGFHVGVPSFRLWLGLSTGEVTPVWSSERFCPSQTPTRRPPRQCPLRSRDTTPGATGRYDPLTRTEWEGGGNQDKSGSGLVCSGRCNVSG